MGKLSLLILGSISFAVIAVAALLFPTQIGEFPFWLKTLWLLFLVFLNWAASTFVLFKVHTDRKSSLFGALPGISIFVFLYSVASGGILMTHWETPGTTSHLILQVVSGTICSVVVLLSFIAAKGAEIPSIPEGTISKEELLRQIKRVETRFSGDGLKNISEVREKLQYSAPHGAKIALMPDYKHLCKLVEELENEDKIGEKTRELIDQMRVAVQNCY